MRQRSAGLGKTELNGYFESIERKGDFLIVHMRITNPVRWHVRAAVSSRDMIKLIKLLAKEFFNGTIPYVLLWGAKFEEKPPEF
jgi:hypothetical protein